MSNFNEMSKFSKIANEVFDDIYNHHKDEEALSMKNDLIYVYDNEAKYRCQEISKKLKVRHHKIDQDTGKLIRVFGVDETQEEKEELPYMNFYEKLDEIFSILFNRYNWETDLVLGKERLYEYYDKENAHRYPKPPSDVTISVKNGVLVFE